MEIALVYHLSILLKKERAFLHVVLAVVLA